MSSRPYDGLLLCLHARVFFVDDVEAHFAFAITATHNLVVFVAAFQRFKRRSLFHDANPIKSRMWLPFNKATQPTDIFNFGQPLSDKQSGKFPRPYGGVPSAEASFMPWLTQELILGKCGA